MHNFIEHATVLAAKKASMILIKPGPPANLDQHALEFIMRQAQLP